MIRIFPHADSKNSLFQNCFEILYHQSIIYDAILRTHKITAAYISYQIIESIVVVHVNLVRFYAKLWYGRQRT